MINVTNQVWRKLLMDVLRTGREVRPRDQTTRELISYTTHVPMDLPVVTERARKMGYKFMPAEAAWILSGDNRVSTIAPYGKHLRQFSDDGFDFFGAYGPKFVEQRQYVVQALLKDQMSRQAVMTFWRERPGPTKDVPCTVALQWFVREGHLDCVVFMRSSDAWLGWVYDVFNFSMMSAQILIALRHLGVVLNLGALHLTAGSQHLYKRDWEMAENVLLSSVHSVVADLAPFNQYEFETSDDLTEHLWEVANRETIGRRTWLKELYDVKA